MAVLKDLLVNGAARIFGKVFGESFVKTGGTSSQFLKADGSVDDTGYEPSLPSKTGNSGKVLAVTEDGSGVEWKEMPLLTGGERLLINAYGTYSIDLTDRSVTIINFGIGVTGANITFTLNKPGKRQVVFLSQDKTVGANIFLSCASANMLWMVGKAKFTVTAKPSFFEVIHRMAENSLSVLTATAPTEAELYGKSGSGASWEPPAE